MRRSYSSFCLRKCMVQDIDKVYHLQGMVINGLKNKEVLRENTKDMFVQCVKEPNLTLGVYDGGELAAAAILVVKQEKEEDLSLDLEKHKVVFAANLKLVMVKQEYRGNGFQKALMWLLEKYAYNCGITHLCTTVSGKNYYSLNNIKALDYEYDHSAIKYGGLSREVYVKDINSSILSYNKMIMSIISSIENKNEWNTLVTERFNLERCFQGDLTIANTGDIAEYKDFYLDKTYFGLLERKCDLRVFTYISETDGTQMTSISDNENGLKLQKVWINTERRI